MLASEINLLLERMASQSDELALKQLFAIYYPRLLSFAESFLKNRPVAEEIVEDVFIKLWENRNTLPVIQSLSAYLFTATKNSIINYQKPLKNLPFLNVDEVSVQLEATVRTPEEIFISAETLQNVNDVIASLPPKCKLVFVMVKENGFKYKEVAALLHLSIKTVENHMALALKKISEAFLIHQHNSMIEKQPKK